MCQLCRPDNSLPPHLAMRQDADDEREAILAKKAALHRPPSPPMSPDYPVYYGGYHNTNSYMLDGVMLSERGMQHLKSLTIEKDKRMRKRRMGGPEAMFNPLDPGAGPSHDNSLEGDDDDDDDLPPATPGAPGMSSGNHKDGEIVKPLPDGTAPEAPEGFTIVVKDNGLMVLRKRRYRDLKKVGIGGFQAKVRTPKGQAKGKQAEEELDDNDPNKPKKRVAWRPKKNKILVQYPEYIQDAFFGKDFMAKCPDKMEDDEVLPSPDKKRVHGQEDGKTVFLNKDALAALEEMKAKEEAERKEREAKEEEARAAIEAAAKVAADKARIAQEELEALKKEALEDDSTVEKKGVKEEEKNEDEDLMLPSDLFGDTDIFSIFKGTGTDIDIDDSALDEAEEVDGDEMSAEQQQAAAVNKELSEGLQEMLGPDFNAKDMEDIFNIAASDTSKETATEVKAELKPEDVKQEPTEASQGAASSAPDNFNLPLGDAQVKEEPASTQGQGLMPPPSLPGPASSQDMMTSVTTSSDSNLNSTETFSGQMMVPRLSASVGGTMGSMSASMPMSTMQQTQPPVQQPTMTTQIQPPGVQVVQSPANPQQHLMQQQQQQQQPRMIQGMGERPQLMQPQQQQQQPGPSMMQRQQLQGMPGMMQQQPVVSQQLQPGMQHPQQQQQQIQQQQGMQQQQMQTSMQPQQIQTGIRQQLQPGMQPQQMQQQQVMQQQQAGMQQPLNPGMQQQQMTPGGMQQQQLRPGFMGQGGPMIQQQGPQQHMIGQQQILTQNMMPGQRVVMQQQMMPGQIMQRGQLVQPGGQIIRGQIMQPGQMGPRPGMPGPGQPLPQASGPSNPPTTRETGNTAQNNLQKWEADEPLGENATIAMILYANINHANLKVDYPKWEERIKQIAKIWKNLPNEKRVPYVTKARENRTANRMNRGPVSRNFVFYWKSQVICIIQCYQLTDWF